MADRIFRLTNKCIFAKLHRPFVTLYATIVSETFVRFQAYTMRLKWAKLLFYWKCLAAALLFLFLPVWIDRKMLRNNLCLSNNWNSLISAIVCASIGNYLLIKCKIYCDISTEICVAMMMRSGRERAREKVHKYCIIIYLCESSARGIVRLSSQLSSDS